MPYKTKEQFQAYQKANRDKFNRAHRKYIATHPWIRFLKNAQARCRDKSDPNYGGKGIRCYLTPDEARLLWGNDDAALMNRPSLDRIDPNGDYTFWNCRFIELSENIQRMHASKREAA